MHNFIVGYCYPVINFRFLLMEVDQLYDEPTLKLKSLASGP